MTTDVTVNTKKGYYDFEWTASGDFSTDQTLDTYILIALFEEVRATSTEIPQANLRRGWLGNETTPDFQQGSKAWLFEQDRITGSRLAELGVVIRNALQPLIDDGLAINVDVETPFLKDGKVSVFINLFRDGSRVDRRFFELWENTGNF